MIIDGRDVEIRRKITQESIDTDKRLPMEHITSILREFEQKAVKKYKKGQREHGGRLWRKAVYELMEGEVLDFVVYYFTAQEQLQVVKAFLRMGIIHKCPHCLQAYNLLTFGNAEGKQKVDK
jgi:hypothetical protein